MSYAVASQYERRLCCRGELCASFGVGVKPSENSISPIVFGVQLMTGL